MGRLREFEERLHALGDDYQIRRGKRPQPAEIETEERRLGAFPEAYRQFLARFGGLIVEVDEDVWPRPRELQAVEPWRHEHGFAVCGVGGSLPASLRLAAREDGAGVAFFHRTGDRLCACFRDGRVWVLERGAEPLPFSGDCLDFLVTELERLVTDSHRLRAETNGPRTLRHVLRAVASRDPSTRAGAIHRLEALTPQEQAAAIPSLLRLLADAEVASTVVARLADTVEAEPASARPAVPALCRRFGADADELERADILRILAVAGDGAAEALSVVQAGLVDTDEDVRELAAVAAGALGRAAPDEIAAALTAVLDRDAAPDVTLAAAVALARLEREMTRAVDTLAARLDAAHDVERARVLTALAGAPSLGAALGDRVEEILAAQEKDFVRMAAAEALVAWGRASMALRPFLEQCASGASPYLRDRASRCLARIEGR